MEYYYLAHHGIKGQKWGHRRFQNKDGSLTQEGYQHWGLNPDGSKFKERGHAYSRHTVGTAKKGFAAGAVAGAVAGIALGPVGVMGGAWLGSVGGGLLGTSVGAIQTHNTRKKIRRMLDENGKVYVKDL